MPPGRYKKSLPTLRAWLAKYRKSAALSGEPKVAEATYEFFYQGPDMEEPLEITEEEFNASPGEDKGHPRVGTYIVEVWSKPDDGDEEQRECLHRETGDWNGADVASFQEREQDSSGMAGAMRAIGASYRQNTSDLHAEIARLREQLAGAKLDISEFQNTSQEDGHLLTQTIKERDLAIARLAAWKAEAEAWRLVDDRYPMTHSPVVREARERRAATDAIEKNAS